MSTGSFKLVFLTLWFAPGVLLGGEIAGAVRLPPGVDGSLSPAVVYVATDRPEPGPQGTAVEVDQRNLQFVPRVQALALGGSIIFRNSDREAHNVNSQSSSDCCSFNQMVGPGKSFEVRPQRAGVVRLLCNIHQYMRGYVVVCPNSLFAVTDAAGRFRIENVPDGTHRVIVWQEFSKRSVTDVEVSGVTQAEFELEPSGQALPKSMAAGSSPLVTTAAAVPWPEVRRQIASTLEQAVRAAERPDGGPQAERLVLDAYFRHFEASDLETAVRLYRGEERNFAVERMFERIRKPLMSDLAAGRIAAPEVKAAISELIKAIDDDIVELQRRGITDRTKITAVAPATAASSPGRAVNTRQVMSDLRAAFGRVEQLVGTGNRTAAASALADAYFEVFHRIEPAIAARSFADKRRLEEQFMELRGQIGGGIRPSAARAGLDALWAEIDRAAAAIERSQVSGTAALVNGFSNAFVILAREGTEALLIVTALLLYLSRIGQPEAKRAIYGGLVVALVATAATWAALQWVIARAGAAQELIEGVVALVAAAVLFYVSYWLISKSEARHWQEFLTRQVGRGISTGRKWALALTAFLAVYREGAETILMFQPLLVEPSANQLLGVGAGIAGAAAALVAVFWWLRFASIRLAIRPFFRVTGVLLFALAVVFAGKGAIELQEAHVMTYTPLGPSPLRSAIEAMPLALRDALGIGVTVQSLVIQCALLVGAAASLVAVWVVGRLAPATGVVASVKPVVSGPAA